MKKFRRVLSIILVFVLSLCFTTEAKAIETRASLYLSSYLAYVYPDGNGKVSVWFEVESTHTMDEVGVITIRLKEQAPDSSAWTTVKTYFHTDYPSMLGSNVAHYDSHVNYSGKSGYKYMAYVTVWAGDDGNGDSRIIKTDEITAK